MRSGVTLYSGLPLSLKDVSAAAKSVLNALGARIASDDGVLVAEIAVADEIASLEVGLVASSVAPPEIARLLGDAPAGAVRIETLVRPEELEATSRAEAILSACAADLALRFAALAYDDLGFVYDPVELDTIGKRGVSRAESFAYLAALALREAPGEETAAEAEEIDLGNVQRLAAPNLPFPDLATSSSVVFAAAGPRVPLVDLTRIVMACAGDRRTNPRRRPVIVFGPALEAGERRALYEIGIETIDAVAGLAPEDGDKFVIDDSSPVRQRARRDELALFSPLPIDARRARDILAGLILDLRESPCAGDASMPRSMECVAPDPSVLPGFPIAIGKFEYARAGVEMYHLDLETAHPLLRASVKRRGEIEAVLGSPPRSVTLIELARTAEDGEEDFLRADAISVAVAQAFYSAARTLAADATGTLFGPDELMKLVTTRQGRSQSWSARLARARSGVLSS